MPAYVNSIILREKSSWHGLEKETGGIFTGDIGLTDALERIKGDYNVEVWQAGAVSPDGDFYEDPDRFFVMRPPTPWADDKGWKRLRVHGSRYNAIQNRDVVRLLEPLAEDFPLEAMAILKDGAIFYTLLQLPDFTIGGHPDEMHRSFLVLADDKTQGSAVFGTTNVRVVCSNTFAIALGKNTLTRIPHYTETEEEIAFRTFLIEKANEQRKQEIATLTKMANTPVVKADVDAALNELFAPPNPTRNMKLAQQVPADAEAQFAGILERAERDYANWERMLDRNQRRREEIVQNFAQFNDEHSYYANTQYALMNAVTQFTSHSDDFTGSGSKKFVARTFGQIADINNKVWGILNES